MKWFDAHLDLACMAVNGRDMDALPQGAGGLDQPASVTLPSLAAGGVAACLATVFTEADGKDAVGYPAGDAAAAHRAGLAQIAVYQGWAESGRASIGLNGGGRGLRMGILIEGADPVTGPDELAWWVEQGVVAMGLAWARGTRYTGGNMDAHGLTDLGRAMVKEMDRLGVVHDVSHLSDAAMDEVLESATGPVMASHSNCAALIEGPPDRSPAPPRSQAPLRLQRHLRDRSIRAIVERGGVIGLNLFSKFLIRGGSSDGRGTVGMAADHVEYVCGIAGHRRCVGLGSDMDGGFSALKLPEGIDEPRDLVKLAEELRRRGWSDGEVEGFAWGNWGRFFGVSAKEPRAEMH